jgi:hypothetical protein
MPTPSPRVLGLLGLLGLAACGDPTAPTYTVAITGARTYVAIQDGDGPWQRLAVAADGTASFTVTAGYHAAAALCGDDPVTTLLNAILDAGATTWSACAPPRTTVRVSGALVPATATAWVGNFATSLPGRYSASVVPGRHDLVATADGRAVIVHDQMIDADRVIDLDIDANGFALATVTPTVTGDGGAAVTGYAELHTAHGTYVQTSHDGYAIVPAAQRAAGDRVVIGAQRSVDGRNEVVQRLVAADAAPALAFEPLPALAIARAGLEVGDGWEFARASYFTAGSSTSLRTSMQVTPAWVAASGGTAAPLVDAAALPEWSGPSATAPGTAVRALVIANIGDGAGDYRAAGLDTTLTW